MIKSKTLRFVFLAVALMILAIGAFTFSVQSHAASPSASKMSTAHVSILRHKGGDAFGKATITITLNTAFQFNNRTNSSQSVTSSNGRTVVTIAAKSTAPYVFKKVGSYKFSLASNSAATLTVTVQ